MEPDLIRRPAITGIGLVTPLGESAPATWDALLAGRAISDHARAQGYSGNHRAVEMTSSAAAEAMAEAGWDDDVRADADTGLFVGTSKGTIEAWMRPDAKLPWGLSSLDAELARRFAFGQGARMTVSAACSSGLHALARAAMAISSGEIQRALVVGVEASVHPLFIASFQRLGVLAPAGHGCRPMDESRKGFVISEAAAAICLDSSSANQREKQIYLDRWVVGGDGTHLTGGDPEAKALRRMLARILAGGCDLVHAHATGTAVSDPVELSAIAAAGHQGCVYSHKGALGHSLGAAGMVAVVINCISHRKSLIPGNVQTTHPLVAGELLISRSPTFARVDRSVVLAAGFGGPLGAVRLVYS